MMFSGYDRTQRRVDLRGRSRNEETREQTTTRLRREKEKRQTHALQINSASIIQVGHFANSSDCVMWSRVLGEANRHGSPSRTHFERNGVRNSVLMENTYKSES